MRNIQQIIAANTPRARELHAQLCAGLHSRLAADIAEKDGQTNSKGLPMQPSPEWGRAIEWAEKDPAGSIRQIAALGKSFDFAHFVAILPNTAKGKNFVACKVVEKVLKFVSAVFEQNPATASEYTIQVLFNTLQTESCEISNNDGRASISRRIEPSKPGVLASRGDKWESTAAAQMPQVRMLADILGFAIVNKGARGDIMKIKPENVPHLRELFGIVK